MATSSSDVLDVFKPPWYHLEQPSNLDMNICSIIFGFSLCLAVLTAIKASHQTTSSWNRRHRITAYVAMIWSVWIANLICGIIGWLNLWGTIPPSFWLSLTTVLLWAVTVQCITQIILNRVSLMVFDRRRVRTWKWIAFVSILVLNVSVVVVWLPASLQINDTWIKVHSIWDRCKQVILSIIDLAANWYFIHVVRTQLIAGGLSKYTSLFWSNVALIALALALDVAFIGMMSMPYSMAPYQFQQIVYLSRLYIEMSNADLVTRIVQDTVDRSRNLSYQINNYTDGVELPNSPASNTFSSNAATLQRHSASEHSSKKSRIDNSIEGTMDNQGQYPGV